MVLACDGGYDVLENDELYKIIHSRLSVKTYLERSFDIKFRLFASNMFYVVQKQEEFKGIRSYCK